MAKIMNDNRILEPTLVGEVAMTRRTKGTPFTNGGPGTELTLNLMPPGLSIVDDDNEPDDIRIDSMRPMAPIMSSADMWTKG
jgi:hypothetical protein